jgi:hypothetical protein
MLSVRVGFVVVQFKLIVVCFTAILSCHEPSCNATHIHPFITDNMQIWILNKINNALIIQDKKLGKTLKKLNHTFDIKAIYIPINYYIVPF